MNHVQKRQPSQQAQAAAMIRKYCKGLGVKCSATSDSFSMGDSVNVTIYDQPPTIAKQIETYAAQFQYGSFDGMNDLYSHTNTRNDLPQSKYVFVRKEFSADLKQAAWSAIRAHYAEAADAPENYENADQVRVFDTWGGSIIHRVLCGSQENLSELFWADRKPAAPAKVDLPAAACNIEQHTHTKRGFEMWIVVQAERVERSVYLAQLDAAKALGGWYSRKWGTTPAGFAFKSEDAAKEFAATLTTGGTPPTPTTKPTRNPAEKLRGLADKMQGEIDNKFADRRRNTPKQQREAASARLDGERLARTQDGLRKLADLHDAGTVPADLATITSKKAVFDLARSAQDTSNCGYYDAPRCTGKPASQSPAALALWALLDGKTDAEKKADTLREMTEKIRFSKIAGYFPTPEPLAWRMIKRAQIEPHHKRLEPQAGSGDLADLLGENVDCCEVSPALQAILRAKGHNLVASDFLEAEIQPIYDRIVMNPPFEKLADIDHVRKAFACLAPGGRLVSIMSPGPFFREASKAADFRDWFDDLAGDREDVPAGTFKESGTGVASVMITLDKP